MSLVRVYIARDAMDAHHLRAILEERGFSAKVIGESLRAAWPRIPATASTLPAVWVDKEDTEGHATAGARDGPTDHSSCRRSRRAGRLSPNEQQFV